MRVVLINGSPHKNGNTALALQTVADALQERGIETETIQVGNRMIRGCMACGACSKTGRCAFEKDDFHALCEKVYTADGLIIGSPVYYAGVAGTMKAFLDKLFYASAGRMRHKVGAAVAVLRRSGGMSTFDELNHYFLISEMVVAPSSYWNIIHGAKLGEAAQDAEGLDTLRVLAANMAWLLQMKEQTAKTLPPPPAIDRARTNFIR